MTYWRRRFVALATGLAVLAAMAWAFSGVLGASGVSDAAVDHPSAAHDGGAGTSGSGNAGRLTGSDGSGTGASGGSSAAGSDAGRAGKTGSAAKSSSAGKTSSARKAGTSGASGRAGSAGPGSAGKPAPGAHAPDQATATGLAQAADLVAAPRTMRACTTGDVVLSLFASRDRYGPHQLPQFDIDVVSTAARSCAFDVGRKFLTLTVRAHGKRIWDSSECASGRHSQVIKLVRGVPAILPVTWDLDRSSARGCAKTSHPALTGRFAASAADAGLASNTVTFLVR